MSADRQFSNNLPNAVARFGVRWLDAARRGARPSTSNPRLSGAALPFVLILLALNVVVIVAMLAYATTEYQASRNSVQAESARALAQSGIELAAGLISANSTNNAFVSYQRVPLTNGAYRLETKIGNVVATDSTQPWKTAVSNPVVLHSGFTADSKGFDLNYAVDPTGSAGYIAPRTTNSTYTTNWVNLSSNMFLMDWIYVFKTNASGSNNVVGRIAYWVDDESSKLNVNYSGNPSAYSSNWSGNTFWENFTIKRPSGAESRNLDPTKWPIFLDLGGIAGINTNQSIAILRFRGDPLHGGANTTNYPSPLAVRIADNTVLTNIFRQSEFGFTATVYSKEAERSYSKGVKRMDLVDVQDSAPFADTVQKITNAITNISDKFAEKYDLYGFASALYASVQNPGTGTNPAKVFGSSQQYTRALPVVNEINITASIGNENGTNTVKLLCDAELIMLSVIKVGAPHYSSWFEAITSPSKYRVDIELPAGASFGAPAASGTISVPGPSSSSEWFPVWTNRFGPTFTNNLAYALTKLTVSKTVVDVPTPNWVFPTSDINVRVYYSNSLYHSFSFAPVSPTNQLAANFAPGENQTNVVYHLVAQPKSSDGYRGDPRFGKFVASNIRDTTLLQTNQQASIGSLNTNGVSTNNVVGSTEISWQIGEYASAASSPDLTPPNVFFHNDDRGLPQLTGDKYDGFSGTGLAGVGWLGEVAVTTRPGQLPVLAWSTPRLWGDGRSVVNGTNYPPDWLLMDAFHLATFSPQPEFPGSASTVFFSYGRINVNSAKSFFQIARGSPVSDTIMDSMTLNAKTKDFRLPSIPPVFTYTGWKSIPTNATRTNFLNAVQEMATNRSSTNNPYVTPFEFLADLAATNISGIGGADNQWMAPIPGTNNTAINTTDRRAESIIRSLAHKFTTHGNQFMIFSVGQALQPAADNAVDAVDVPGGGKAKVVGEAYLQAVYERAPLYDSDGKITNSPTGAPPMRQLFLRELR